MRLLRRVLGESYGGPSISYENGKFILYEWTDAPVRVNILVEHEEWDKFIQKVRVWKDV